ncbi:DUF3108 domain-containing protein [Thiosulfativibrio zosterae]|uniref:DUF3298 domain-containing protein n=1 Tax=Thiosulfativibrio zosterae TaxID=2675053 RepID=A0A6F8PMU3_9GAMM|nr:DUF3108 domain-containing protein [Thiosulfativibrio zosterae]BBP43388.1 hypothetical protein THMIRHAT_11340 [Thiosulfativibrio zosterae]
MNSKIYSQLLKSFIPVVLLLMTDTVQAVTLKDFKATFDVRVLGFNVGEATQTLSCDQDDHQCNLVSEAIPPSWARRFINEESIEKIQLSMSEEQFKLLEYKKLLTRHYDDKTEHKTYTIQLETQPKQLRYLEGDKTWPAEPLAFDVISLAYAIQYQVLNKRPLEGFYLQDEKQQTLIELKKTFIEDDIEPDFVDDAISALRFEFSNAKIEAKLWLVPQYGYFPGRIEILNKEKDRRIVLEINKAPKFY